MKSVLFANLFLGSVAFFSCSDQNNTKPSETPSDAALHAQPVNITILSKGAKISLSNGKFLQTSYKGNSSHLSVCGTLPNGRILSVRFNSDVRFDKEGETSDVDIFVGEEPASNELGHSFYNLQTKKVTGAFTCVLPTGEHIFGSFNDTPMIPF